MSSERLFMTIVGLLIAITILTVGAHCTHQNQMVADVIASGKDPILARCAFDAAGNTAPVCAIRAAKLPIETPAAKP